MPRKISSVPGLVLEWIPVWIPLQVGDKDEAFVRVADPQRWDSPVVEPKENDDTPDGRDALARTLPLSSFLSPVLIHAILFGWAVSSSLGALASKVPLMDVEHAELWFLCIAIGMSIVYTASSIYSNLQRQFQALWNSVAVRRQVLRDKYHPHKARRWSLPTTVLAVLLVVAGIAGVLVESMSSAKGRVAVLRGNSVADLAKAGVMLHDIRPHSSGDFLGLDWTLYVLKIPSPHEGWDCFDLQRNRQPVLMRWRITFDSKTEGLRLDDDHSAWIVTETGTTPRSLRGFDDKVVEERVDHWEFETKDLVPIDHLPPPLMLRFQNHNERLLQEIASSKIAIHTETELKCSDEAEAMWRLGEFLMMAETERG